MYPLELPYIGGFQENPRIVGGGGYRQHGHAIPGWLPRRNDDEQIARSHTRRSVADKSG